MLARIALLLVVIVDLMGQGLIFPIINSLLIDPTSTFVAKDTSGSTRNLYYGIVSAAFYLFWFFGAAYISKLSDYIGRKTGIVICLAGGIAGYVLTILAIEFSSLWLLIVGRAISGFTAGNQPIAQAALIDISRNDQERSANLGYIVGASALGMMIGPLLSGLLSDSAVVGSFASLKLPFYAAIVLVSVTLILIVTSFFDVKKARKKIDFGLSEVFLTIYRVKDYPVVQKLSFAFFFFQIGLNAFFIYIEDYLIERFQFTTFENSGILFLVGASIMIGGTVLVPSISKRYRKIPTIAAAAAIMSVFILLFMVNPVPVLSFVLVVPVLLAFGLGYPTFLALFSASVDDDHQGWVMGITIAWFCLGSGLISILGGALMSVSIYLPFTLGLVSFGIALTFIFTLWRAADVQALDPAPSKESLDNAVGADDKADL
ncbi:MFS transporter [Roseibium sp. MMSF_3544]|uniref:MFS transporter n=1 Tax=unclassified Roseibium TaxID=2629323 RepID=UPI00273E603B|nr:MFS transporter [Roseibium sp. MMSF_3544]